MRDFERRQRLIAQNTWWVDARWRDSDPDLREARLNALDSYDPRPLAGISAGSLYLFMGPRRAGKSVAVKREIDALISDGVSPQRIVFCACEGLNEHDLRRVVAIACDLTRHVVDRDRYWFFDEITYVKDWPAALKQLRDATALRDGSVVATGSSTADLRAARGDLGGREGSTGGVRILLPMPFRAFMREIYPDLADNLPSDVMHRHDLQTEASKRYFEALRLHVDGLALAWERYIEIGGFPRAVADAKTGVDISRATADGLWNILSGDVLRVGQMSDRDIKELLTALVGGIGSPLNVRNLTGRLAIGTRNTVADRINRLCASLFAWRVSVTHDGKTKVLGGQEKLYFIDPVITRLPSLRDTSTPAPDISYLAEQAVGVALLRTVAAEDVSPLLDEDALLVRRHAETGAEIDFVGPLHTTPIESKYVSQKWKGERRALDEHYQRGIVATRDILDMADSIWAVPATLVAWSLGA